MAITYFPLEIQFKICLLSEDFHPCCSSASAFLTYSVLTDLPSTSALLFCVFQRTKSSRPVSAADVLCLNRCLK